jgi:putative transposase
MSDTQYKTFRVWVKKGHRLFPYFGEMCQQAKNVHNTTNFHIRQVYTAYRQETPLQPLQQEVLDTLQQYIAPMNERQRKAYRSRLVREQQKPPDQRKDITCNEFSLPSKEHPYVDYSYLDSLFKAMKHADYRSLPTQSSQWVMKSVFQNWKSFFASIKDYRQHPEKYTVLGSKIFFAR